MRSAGSGNAYHTGGRGRQDLPRKRAGELPAIDGKLSIDQNVIDPLRLLMRIVENRLVADCLGIEYDQLGHKAFPNQSANREFPRSERAGKWRTGSRLRPSGVITALI